jgi:hypothetical protein
METNILLIILALVFLFTTTTTFVSTEGEPTQEPPNENELAFALMNSTTEAGKTVL